MSSCSLCDLVKRVESGEGPHEEIVWRSAHFIVVFCNNPDHPGTPMAVYREHTETIPPEELNLITEVMKIFYSQKVPRGKGMLTIKDHWHEHWVPKGES